METVSATVNRFIVASFPPEASRPLLTENDKAVTAPVWADRS